MRIYWECPIHAQSTIWTRTFVHNCVLFTIFSKYVFIALWTISKVLAELWPDTVWRQRSPIELHCECVLNNGHWKIIEEHTKINLYTSSIYLFNIITTVHIIMYMYKKKLYCYSVKDLNIRIFLDFHHKNSDNFSTLC